MIRISLWSFVALMPGFLFAAAPDPIYQLFEDESDRMAINQMPLELDPISLGFDASSEKRMEGFLNPPAIEATLASLVDRLSPDDLKPPVSAADVASYQRKEKDGLTIEFPTGQIFEKRGSALLTKKGESLLAGAAEVIARYPLQPVSIEVSDTNAAAAKKQSARISSALADLLMRNPEEFVVQVHSSARTDASAEANASIRIKILGAKP